MSAPAALLVAFAGGALFALILQTRFWYGWPSWRVELLGGAGLALTCLASAWLWHAPWWVGAGAAGLAAVGYELLMDPGRGQLGHRPWRDVGQRAVGMVLGGALWFLITRIT